ncbi:glutathione peroxidase [Paenibacillus cymbidii]|uniref:glutathione peroxidase n=1 Tax=Paenibacillus cymbidii TaxID=1639034 RepID=UPI00108059E0|nr:glutathione peroxidase [Paenibacillus cymbidii]
MNIYDFNVQTIGGEEKTLAEYRGQVLLIVNTATQCGLAPQFDGLEKLYQTYKEQGFTVLGFPCNQFREQEPGDNGQVEQACRINFGVTFPLFAKIDVNGNATHPLYRYLKKEAGGLFGSGIKWNFTKFLIDRDGRVVKRFSPTTTPARIVSKIERLIGAPYAAAK